MTSGHHPDADGATRYKYDDPGRMRFSGDGRQRTLTPGRVTYNVYEDFERVTRVGAAAADFASLDKVVEETLSLSLVVTNLCELTVFSLSYSHTYDILL